MLYTEWILCIVYSLKENHSRGYDLDVCKELPEIYGTDWYLLCYVDFTETATRGVLWKSVP